MGTACKGRDLETKTSSSSAVLAKNSSKSVYLESRILVILREKDDTVGRGQTMGTGTSEIEKQQQTRFKGVLGSITNHFYTPRCLRVNSWAFLQVAQRTQCAHPPSRQVNQVERVSKVGWNPWVLCGPAVPLWACPCTSAQEMWLRIWVVALGMG